jgi:hypothetical protein
VPQADPWLPAVLALYGLSTTILLGLTR